MHRYHFHAAGDYAIFIIISGKISKATIELEEYPASLLLSKKLLHYYCAINNIQKIGGKAIQLLLHSASDLDWPCSSIFFQKKARGLHSDDMKKNPQAPLKLNLNPRPSTKPYHKGRERERWGKSSPQGGGKSCGARSPRETPAL